MLLDLMGVLKPFHDVEHGELFIHFAGGARGLGMKAFNEAEPRAWGVLMFERPHPAMNGPYLLEPHQFENRDVLVLPNAVFRPSYKTLTALADGSPPRLDDHGALIFVGDTALVRAYGGHGALDVDLRTGGMKSARNHPGSMWLPDWEIVFPGPTGDTRLFERQEVLKRAA